ncbi:MAG: PEP-CTERM sorting domain-containing protein [Phycisphaerae bacterium]|nr:DVUA0089 family protein [Phycisphaerae bacterium]NUQ47998.1 PEP-CTERM sorting domain-containing protein [Phycisphaerae bacterium]
MLRFVSAAVVIVTFTFAGDALCGPDWLEQGGSDCSSNDAGSSTNTAQVPTGTGSLETVSGGLGGDCGTFSDYEDVYMIRITDPMGFSAATTPAAGGSADFDTQLWLFSVNGFGLLANNDASPQSYIGPTATDNTGQTIPGPGIYFLAVSGFGNAPLGFAGQNLRSIFRFDSPTEISGPDGDAGGSPLAAWEGPGDIGGYTVRMTGVEFVPEPGSLALIALGAGLLGRRRTRR